jgi:hypothetical protein
MRSIAHQHFLGGGAKLLHFLGAKLRYADLGLVELHEIHTKDDAKIMEK